MSGSVETLTKPALLTRDESNALREMLKWAESEHGKSQQGYFSPGGWCGYTLQKLLERSSQETPTSQDGRLEPEATGDAGFATAAGAPSSLQPPQKASEAPEAPEFKAGDQVRFKEKHLDHNTWIVTFIQNGWVHIHLPDMPYYRHFARPIDLRADESSK